MEQGVGKVQMRKKEEKMNARKDFGVENLLVSKEEAKKKEKKSLNLPKGITRCSDGRYQARYTYEGHRYCLYGRDVKELEERLNNAKYEIQHGMYAKEERISLNSWYETWLNEYKSMTVKKGTVESYECMYNYYVGPALGKKLLKDIRGEHIQKLYNDLSRNGYSKSTISLIHVLLGAMFKQAVKNELVKKNPVDLTTLPRGEKKKERRVLTLNEQEILLKEITGHELEPMIKLSLATGLRVGEVTGLEWRDIDFDKNEITVRGTLKCTRKGMEYYKDTPKTDKSNRSIPLLANIELMLKRYRIVQKEHKLSMGSDWKPMEGLEDLVFLREGGKPFSGQHIRQQLVHIVDSINEKYFSKNSMGKDKGMDEKFEYFTPHTLRHTFATRALENGIPPKVVQEILGHSSITMTLDLYTHVLPQTKAEEMKKMMMLI
ncbi:tyrosine-type recombinase/integrase [Lachnoclostridium phytofermentans]|uniref:tyrosine-type recombinase/integrase n=1 Tax=Lachnoclostridium phytofermentans TaxID=66219 RepID=UPI00068D1EC1|nr:site-specific integrase [Lachnoclostridium phytofermentans]